MSLLHSRRKLFIFGLFITAILLLSCSEKVHISGSPRSELKIDQQILDYVNQYRQSKHLSPLQINPVISTEAEKHSIDMASKKLHLAMMVLKIV